MIPIANAVLMMALHVLRDQVVEIVKLELAGENVNKDRIAQNVRARLGMDHDELRIRLKSMLEDGWLDEKEMAELREWVNQV